MTTLPAGAALAAIGSSRTTATTMILHAIIGSLLWILPGSRIEFSRCATLGFAWRRVKVRERLFAGGDEPEALRLASALEQPADLGPGRNPEARHDVLAPHQRRRVGA